MSPYLIIPGEANDGEVLASFVVVFNGGALQRLGSFLQRSHGSSVRHIAKPKETRRPLPSVPKEDCQLSYYQQSKAKPMEYVVELPGNYARKSQVQGRVNGSHGKGVPSFEERLTRFQAPPMHKLVKKIPYDYVHKFEYGRYSAEDSNIFTVEETSDIPEEDYSVTDALEDYTQEVPKEDYHQFSYYQQSKAKPMEYVVQLPGNYARKSQVQARVNGSNVESIGGSVNPRFSTKTGKGVHSFDVWLTKQQSNGNLSKADRTTPLVPGDQAPPVHKLVKKIPDDYVHKFEYGRYSAEDSNISTVEETSDIPVEETSDIPEEDYAATDALEDYAQEVPKEDYQLSYYQQSKAKPMEYVVQLPGNYARKSQVQARVNGSHVESIGGSVNPRFSTKTGKGVHPFDDWLTEQQSNGNLPKVDRTTPLVPEIPRLH